MQRVLVMYASRYGATCGIAEVIAHVLRRHHLNVVVLPVEQVEDPTPYNAVILGSAVYHGQWLKPAVNFIKTHAEALADRPTWLFSSGPTGEGDPSEMLNGFIFPEALRDAISAIHPRDVVLFHGTLDVDRINLAERMILKVMRAPMGDYRCWDTIEDWATEIAATLEPARA
ncbi:MAG: flavodoxin domain-containing protein [Phototrophicaceae bacterium]